jgi:hypothetical protein
MPECASRRRPARHIHSDRVSHASGSWRGSRAFFHKATVFQHTQLKPPSVLWSAPLLQSCTPTVDKVLECPGGGGPAALVTSPRSGVHTRQSDQIKAWHAQGFSNQTGSRFSCDTCCAARADAGRYPLNRTLRLSVLGTGAAIDVMKQKRRRRWAAAR